MCAAPAGGARVAAQGAPSASHAVCAAPAGGARVAAQGALPATHRPLIWRAICCRPDQPECRDVSDCLPPANRRASILAALATLTPRTQRANAATEREGREGEVYGCFFELVATWLQAGGQIDSGENKSNVSNADQSSPNSPKCLPPPPPSPAPPPHPVSTDRVCFGKIKHAGNKPD